MKNKGFTLIEVVIYIALFSIIITGAFVTAYNLFENTSKLESNSYIQNEGNFVMKKIEWALSGISSTTSDVISPSTSYPYTVSGILNIKKYYLGEKMNVKIQYDGTNKRILFSEKGSSLSPITTDNVKVTKLEFQYIPSSGSSPFGITANITINGKDFTVTKYIRK